MTNYSERVKVLRGLANGIWKNCEYTWFSGEEKVFADAADAIEELQAEVNKANKSADAYRAMYFAKHGDITIEKVRELDEIDCHFHSALIRLMYRRIEELEAKNKKLHGRIEDKELQIDMLTADNTNYEIAIDELKAQMPKRGEWILTTETSDDGAVSQHINCSVCGFIGENQTTEKYSKDAPTAGRRWRRRMKTFLNSQTESGGRRREMTKYEAIVVSAYTGFLMCDFNDMHEYIEKKLGRPIYTHEFALDFVQDEIHEKVKLDFLKICGEVNKDNGTESKPKLGKWIQVGDALYKCSICDEISCCRGNFCPDCGTKMEV